MESELDLEQAIPAADMEAIENYMVWRQHVGEMYSLLREKKLPEQSLTFDWLPNNQAVIANFSEQDSKILVVKPEISTTPIWEKSTTAEVNRARVLNLGDQSYIAVITGDGTVMVFDYTKTEREPLVLRAHETNGFAIAWTPDGILATGADDRKITIYEIDFNNWTSKLLQQTTVDFGNNVEEDTKGINDLQWRSDLLVAACDDGFIRVYNKNLEPKYEKNAQQGTVDCLASSPFTQHMFASAGSDHTIALWDVRDLAEPLHIMAGHEKQIVSIKFSPVVDGLLASAGEDARVIVWDIRKIGGAQDADDAEEATPEIAFVHGGHVMMVNDISWHPTRPWVLASVAEDCALQIWAPNELTTGNMEQPPNVPSGLV